MMKNITNKNSIIFISGSPLSGKTTIAVKLGSNIEGISILSMDIVRIFSQMLEDQKPD